MLTACPPGGNNEETTSQPDETTDQTTAGPDVTTGECQVGMLGCPCTGGGACDPGLECNAQKLCEPSEPVTSETDGLTTGPSMTTTTTGTGDTTDEPSTGTTEPAGRECTPVGDGRESAECVELDPTRPFCDVDTCKPCGDLADDICVGATDGERPICHAGGRCVECDDREALSEGQCAASEPHCNLDTNACEGCFEHSECPETACDIAARQCFPKNKRLFIRQAAPCSDKPNEGGDMTTPFCDYNTALAKAKDLNESGITFVLLGNIDGTSPGAVTVAPDGPPVSYAFVHEPGGPGDAHTQFKGAGPLILVGNNVTLYIVDFTLNVGGNLDSSRGVDCQDFGAVWLDDSRIFGARGPGIRAAECKVHLRRTAVSNGLTEGIELTDSSLFMVNSFVANNAFVFQKGGGGLTMHAGSTADITFSTIVDNRNEPNVGLGDSIHCDDASVTIKIRNSIVARTPGTGNSSVVTACTDANIKVDNSTIDFETPGNNSPKKAAEDLLMRLLGSKGTGAYRLDPTKTATELKDFALAVRQPGDPHFDFDFEVRNPVMGMLLTGADTVVPAGN